MRKTVIITQDDLEKIIYSAVSAAVDLKLASIDRKPEYEYKSVLTVDEASAFLRMAKATLYKKTAGKLIPFTKVGNILKFHKTDLENWLMKSKSHSKEVA